MLTPTPNSRSHETATAILLFASWLIIGIPIALCYPGIINQDTYLYLTIANQYLQIPSWHVHDAYTVGPVIPAALAVAKWAILKVIPWNPDVDVGLVKYAALLCYITYTLAAVTYYRRKGLSAYVLVFGVAVVFFSLPAGTDVVSLNGELVCIALLAAFFAVAARESLRGIDRLALVTLALLVLYTKIQAILLLGLAFYTCLQGQERRRILIAFVLSAAVVELALLRLGGGWLMKLVHLVGYVGSPYASTGSGGSQSIYNVIAARIGNLAWVANQMLRYVPLGGAALVAATVTRGTDDGRAKHARVWLLAAIVTIALPGRQFDHYILFLLPAVFLFGFALICEMLPTVPPAWLTICTAAVMVLMRLCTIAPTSAAFRPAKIAYVIPRQFISSDVSAIDNSNTIGDSDTLLVHGWDFRYYSFFNKPNLGPELSGVTLGVISPQTYIDQVMSNRPTVILDVVNYSGVVQNPTLAISAMADWRQRIESQYQTVYNQNGLVAYRRRDTLGKGHVTVTTTSTPAAMMNGVPFDAGNRAAVKN